MGCDLHNNSRIEIMRWDQLTGNAPKVPELEGAIVTSRYDAIAIIEELGRKGLPTVTRQRRLQQTNSSHENNNKFPYKIDAV